MVHVRYGIRILSLHAEAALASLAEVRMQAAARAIELIEYGRKSLSVVDAAGLEAVACGCFRVIHDEYDRLLGAGH